MADKLFTLHIVILNHPAALPDAAEQPLVTGRNGHMAASRFYFLAVSICLWPHHGAASSPAGL
jgi:hypothetical protein